MGAIIHHCFYYLVDSEETRKGKGQGKYKNSKKGNKRQKLSYISIKIQREQELEKNREIKREINRHKDPWNKIRKKVFRFRNCGAEKK